MQVEGFLFLRYMYSLYVYVQTRYFENPQVVPDNTVPSPEMVGMITSVVVKTNPEREDSETRTVSVRFSHSAFLHHAYPPSGPPLLPLARIGSSGLFW